MPARPVEQPPLDQALLDQARCAPTGAAAWGERRRAHEALSHNLLGQRLGRKGRDTRERILAAAAALLDEPADAPLSMSAVARGASLGLTTLYLYFKDLTEILLALLDPIVASGEDVYLAQLRVRWPDEALQAHCRGFVDAFHGFWKRHERILHLRNSFADQGDQRMIEHRVAAARPIMDLLLVQMDAAAAGHATPSSGMASALMTGIERAATVTTRAGASYRVMDDPARIAVLIAAEARILRLAIADARAGGGA